MHLRLHHIHRNPLLLFLRINFAPDVHSSLLGSVGGLVIIAGEHPPVRDSLKIGPLPAGLEVCIAVAGVLATSPLWGIFDFHIVAVIGRLLDFT